MNAMFFALGISLLVGLCIGGPIIKQLQKLKFGQVILEEGPRWHRSKQYTPTMGGFIFILASLVGLLVTAWPVLFLEGDFTYLVVFLLAAAFGIIGYLDDYKKVTKKQNLGLTAKQKLLLQVVVALVFLSLLRYIGMIEPAFYVPFLNQSIALPWGVYLALSAFIIVGTVNAVNLTDGIDGLAASVTLTVMVFFAVTGYLMDNMAVSLFAAALVGGLLAFLVFNFNPARVFMGDTGSLFLGGAVAGLAFAADMPLMLVLVGLIYIIETLSDIIQVTYFKATKGKRFFKMAPIHHHFEMIGYSEKQIVALFTGITVLMCVIGYFSILPRF